MKIRKLFAVSLFSVICICLFAVAAACGEKTFTVTFDANGHGTAPQAITDVTEGSTIGKPADPKAENYVFNGWYKDSLLTDDWDFATDVVTSDITLYASWSQTYTVTFDVNGHGEAPQNVTGLISGSKLNKPNDPVAENFAFVGWYKDSLCSERWDFIRDTVSENTTLYAKWKQIYAVSGANSFNREVSDVEYFSVAHDGNYNIEISVAGGEEGATVNYSFNDVAATAILNEYGVAAKQEFLAAGTYKFAKTDGNFNAKVTVQALAMPFDYEETYIGSAYSLEVVQVSNVPAVRISKGYTPTGFSEAVAFDGEFYTVDVRENTGTGYNYFSVKIKIHKDNEKVTRIDLYAQSGGEWATQPDVLERARYAQDAENHHDIIYSSEGALNDADVLNTFEYVYFCVITVKDKWIVFNDFAEGTEFYWCDIATGRTGERCDRINIVAGQPVRLLDTGMYSNRDYIMVKPANGANSVSFTVKEVAAPAGLTAENPAELTVNEVYTMANCNGDSKYYFTFAAPEEGKYIIKVYYVGSGGMPYRVKSCELDSPLAYRPFEMPGVDALYNGAEVNLKATTYNFSVALGGTGGDLVVKFEKVVASALQSGTYVGVGGSYRYFITIDAQANTVSVNREHKTLGSGTNSNIIAETAISCDGETYSAAGLTFIVNADGSLRATYNGTQFDATLQE